MSNYGQPPSYGQAGYPPPAAYSQPPPVAYSQPTTYGEKFGPVSGYRDWPFAILFFAHMIVVIVLAFFAIKQFNLSTDSAALATGVSPSDIQSLIYSILATMAFDILLGFGFLSLAKNYAKQLIYFCMILSIIVYAFAIVFLIFIGLFYPVGIIMIIVFLINVVFFYFWRRRIPFAALILGTVSGLIKKYPATTAVPFVAAIVHLVWNVVWIFAFVTAYTLSIPSDPNNGTNLSILVYVVFVFFYFWAGQVFTNTVHVTICGVFATWYFQMQNMQNPTSNSAKRALTTSFGSICYGSLLVAIIKTLRFLAQTRGNNNGGAMAIIACIIVCLLRCIEQIIQYLNTYAFCQVAIYGKPFCTAAKDTWTLFQQHGIDALVNDNLVGTVLSYSCLLGGIFSAGFAYLICWGLSGSYYPIPVIACVIGLLLGLFVLAIVLQVVHSGVVTIFVCFSMEPSALNANAPELYNKMREAYNNIFVSYGL